MRLIVRPAILHRDILALYESGRIEALVKGVDPHSPDNALSFGAACAIQI